MTAALPRLLDWSLKPARSFSRVAIRITLDYHHSDPELNDMVKSMLRRQELESTKSISSKSNRKASILRPAEWKLGLSIPAEVSKPRRKYTYSEVLLIREKLTWVTACKSSAYWEWCKWCSKMPVEAGQTSHFMDIPEPRAPQELKLEPDHFICVHQQSRKLARTSIASLADTDNVTRRPIATLQVQQQL